MEAVLFGDEGISAGLKAGQIVIDMSSISPAETERFATRLRDKRVEMLDAPVTGGEKERSRARLRLWLEATERHSPVHLPIFEAMGKTIGTPGKVEAGKKTKLVNQILCAQHIVAMADACVLRARSARSETTLKVVSGGAAGSLDAFKSRAEITQNDFAQDSGSGFSTKTCGWCAKP